MSHELEDNVERRSLIVGSMPSSGLIKDDLLKHIMQWGYNPRGAKDKLKELLMLDLIVIKGNKYYPVRKVQHTHTSDNKPKQDGDKKVSEQG
jgi:hypothetical protein